MNELCWARWGGFCVDTTCWHLANHLDRLYKRYPVTSVVSVASNHHELSQYSLVFQLGPFIPSSSSASSRTILTPEPFPNSKEGRRLEAVVTAPVDVSSNIRRLAASIMHRRQYATYRLLVVLLSIECTLSRLLLRTLEL